MNRLLNTVYETAKSEITESSLLVGVLRGYVLWATVQMVVGLGSEPGEEVPAHLHIKLVLQITHWVGE